jgi:hypothetical protein
MTRFVTAAATALAIIALGGCSSSHGTPSATRCDQFRDGAACIKIFGTQHAVADVIAYYSPGSTAVNNKTWRIDLSTFSCDPKSSTCHASASYAGPTRHGNPPASSTCQIRMTNTAPDTNACYKTMAMELAHFGDWPGFDITDATLDVAPVTSLCVSVATETGGTWGAGDVHACARIPR